MLSSFTLASPHHALHLSNSKFFSPGSTAIPLLAQPLARVLPRDNSPISRPLKLAENSSQETKVAGLFLTPCGVFCPAGSCSWSSLHLASYDIASEDFQKSPHCWSLSHTSPLLGLQSIPLILIWGLSHASPSAWSTEPASNINTVHFPPPFVFNDSRSIS